MAEISYRNFIFLWEFQQEADPLSNGKIRIQKQQARDRLAGKVILGIPTVLLIWK